MTIKEQAQIAVKVLDEKLAEDIVILEIGEISVIGDYFIIATGKNVNHVRALSDYVSDELGKKGIYAKQSEGYDNANWILMDFGDYIIHLFDRESREYYNLERIWRDAKNIEAEEFLK